MRSLLVALATATLLLAVPFAAPAAAIGIPILDNLYNWPGECGEQRSWFSGATWARYCESGVEFIAPTFSGSGTEPDGDGCLTCRVLP